MFSERGIGSLELCGKNIFKEDRNIFVVCFSDLSCELSLLVIPLLFVRSGGSVAPALKELLDSTWLCFMSSGPFFASSPFFDLTWYVFDSVCVSVAVLFKVLPIFGLIWYFFVLGFVSVDVLFKILPFFDLTLSLFASWRVSVVTSFKCLPFFGSCLVSLVLLKFLPFFDLTWSFFVSFRVTVFVLFKIPPCLRLFSKKYYNNLYL